MIDGHRRQVRELRAEAHVESNHLAIGLAAADLVHGPTLAVVEDLVLGRAHVDRATVLVLGRQIARCVGRLRDYYCKIRRSPQKGEEEERRGITVGIK